MWLLVSPIFYDFLTGEKERDPIIHEPNQPRPPNFFFHIFFRKTTLVHIRSIIICINHWINNESMRLRVTALNLSLTRQGRIWSLSSKFLLVCFRTCMLCKHNNSSVGITQLCSANNEYALPASDSFRNHRPKQTRGLLVLDSPGCFQSMSIQDHFHVYRHCSSQKLPPRWTISVR